MRFPRKFFTSPNPSIIAQLLSLLLHCKLSRAAGAAMASLVMLSTSAGAEVIENALARYEVNAASEGSWQTLTITSKISRLQLSYLTKSLSSSSCCATATVEVDYPYVSQKNADVLGIGTQYQITLRSRRDDVVEHDEHYGIEVNASDGTIFISSTIKMKILNDDWATITVSNATVAEGGDLVFTATLDKALPSSVTVTPTFTHGTATGADYTANTPPITFAGTAGETKTFRVGTIIDTENEGTEQFTMGLTVSSNTPPWNYVGSGSAITVNSGTGTIHNTDGVPVSITGPTYTIGNHEFDVDITFEQSMTGFEKGDITVGNGSVTRFGGSGASYYATILPTASGTVTVDVPAGVAWRLGSFKPNWPAEQFSVTADRDPPSVSITGPSDIQTGEFTVAIVFSEPVGLPGGPPEGAFEQKDVNVGNGIVTGFSLREGSTATYDVTIRPRDSGKVSVYVEANVARDAGGNPNTESNLYGVQVDPVPTVSITGPTDAQNGPFDVTITFSETVTGFVQSDVTVGNGSVTAFSLGRPYGQHFHNIEDLKTYTATITPAASGIVTVDVAENVAENNDQEGNTAASQFSVWADLNRPTATITRLPDDQNSAFEVTIVFSESVTGFEQSDVRVGNGSVTAFSSLSNNYINTSYYTSYIATITPSASGTVTIDVPANVANDRAGNGNEAASQFSVQVYLPRSIRFEGPTTVRTTEDPFQVKVIFSESPESYDFEPLQKNSTITYTREGPVFDLTLTPSYRNDERKGSWPYECVLRATWYGVKNGPAKLRTDYRVWVDGDPPGFWWSSGITGPTAPQNGPFNVRLGVTEGSLVGFDAEDITVTNGSVTSFEADTDYGWNYTVQITPVASGTVSVQVGAATFKDAAGHDNRASRRFSVLADFDAPTVRITGPTDAQNGPFDATITFSEDVTGFEQSDITVGNGTVTAFSGSGANYTATITPAASGTVTVDVPANVAADAATNSNTAASQFSVEADLNAPTVRITGPTETQTGPFDVTIAFSETVTGFEQNDITASNGTVTALSGSGARYTATITPTATGNSDSRCASKRRHRCRRQSQPCSQPILSDGPNQGYSDIRIR